MILQALVDYYEELASQGKIARPGWAKVKVSWALEIDEDGHLIDVLPLRSPSQDGKKMLPREMELPAQMKRSGKGAPAYYLCDNTKYVFGIEDGKITEKSRKAFENFRNLHIQKLATVENSMAKAIIAFAYRYTPEDFLSLKTVSDKRELLQGNENCVFISTTGEFAQTIPVIAETVDEKSEEEIIGTCMVTGKQTSIARIHNSVKGPLGNSPNGWTLVSFDKDSFAYDSYGKKQGYNAPVSKYAAFAYTSALNHLLSDWDHVKVIGNTTVVYWTMSAESQYQDVFTALLDGGSSELSNTDLNALMTSVAAGKPYNYNGLPLTPENDFYILGLSPNAARLSVRFFYQCSFGEIVQNLKQHYHNIEVVSDGGRADMIPLWALLRETTRYKKADGTLIKPAPQPLPQLAGDVMKSMLGGGRYPETLMNQTMLRIRAEQEISCGKAGIIKAYLIRNTENLPDRESIMEVAQVSLNTESSYSPYVLGRLFAVLEGIQQAANPGINATIKDRFFNSACATPAAVFPILLKLSNSHLKKMDPGKTVFWSRQLGDLLDRLGTDFPAHQSLQEQGAFILGYYHQTQKRFEKKAATDKEEE